MSLTRNAFTTLLVLTAFMATARLAAAATFTSGTHVVDGVIDGVLATGPDTKVTINAPAFVTILPDPIAQGEWSLLINDGAQVIINDGQLTGQIRFGPIDGTPATLDIFDGAFDSIRSSGNTTIHGGRFGSEVISGHRPLNVYGGTFNRLGFDSETGEVNVYARSFTFGDDNAELNSLFPDANFPLDRLGESFSMSTAEDRFLFYEARVTGEALDGSQLAFTPSLDGIGSLNLFIVPEPSSVALVAFTVLSGLASRNAGKLAG